MARLLQTIFLALSFSFRPPLVCPGAIANNAASGFDLEDLLAAALSPAAASGGKRSPAAAAARACDLAGFYDGEAAHQGGRTRLGLKIIAGCVSPTLFNEMLCPFYAFVIAALLGVSSEKGNGPFRSPEGASGVDSALFHSAKGEGAGQELQVFSAPACILAFYNRSPLGRGLGQRRR
jgi:hypothetical protein